MEKKVVELNGYVLLFRSQYRCLGQNDTMASRADNGTNGSYRNRKGEKKGKQYRREDRRESIICKTACR